MTRDDAAEIKRRLNDRLEQLVDYFWPGNVKRGRQAYCAPSDRKTDLGSFVVYLGQVGKYGRGSWVRSSAGIGGDEINLFAYGLTGSHKADREVFDRAREWCGLDHSQPDTEEDRRRRDEQRADFERKRADDERRAREKEAERQRNAGVIWGEIVPISGTHAEGYLLERGIPVPPGGWDDCLGFHPRVIYDLDTSLAFPTLVCRVDDAFGDLTAIWKIHLDPRKPAKAPVEKAKIGAGVAAGGAVRIGGEAPHIGLAEGLETSLAARALIKYRHPVWAGLSTAGVAGFEPPLGVEHITSFPDGDRPWRKHEGDLVLAEPPGRAAVRRLRERMVAIGIAHDSQPEPAIRKDYLDIWNARRRIAAEQLR
ncbi:hypothetical protein [Bradyrhizobium sp. 174]|uniref:DUF7146 domain-containing protein n=1 Tax=Bradyrhizobium sp. 174 TaxID=2782645 RepID=UPI001FFA6080|nr:hypothetical protein [Bradyrhizobium sp. 174]MCK1577840.1 hypothetical protein [Bradyrhizobium sp. 174]